MVSPPYYNVKHYSQYKNYEEYLSFLKEVFLLVHKKTKEGRFLIVNSSPILVPRESRNKSSKRYGIPFDIHNFLIKMNWEFIDDIIWVKPNASTKNRNGGFFQNRKPLAYKPNLVTEYLMIYRKSTEKLIDWNIAQYDADITEESKIKGTYERTNVWGIPPAFNKSHPAVFPEKLCENIIQYYSFKNDLILDPFAGSGTLGKVAERLDRYYFLTERKKEYVDYMDNHLSGNLLNLNEFKSELK